MAQRRVSATGFGGASPGVGILQAVAQGNIARQEREQEARRMAIQERLAQSRIDQTQAQIGLTEEQIEQTAQATRLAEESAVWEREAQERERQAAEAALPFVKNILVEQHGMDPEMAEEITFESADMVLSRLRDAEMRDANLAQVRSSTAANIESTLSRREERTRTGKEHKAREDAFAYMGDQNFFHIAMLDQLDEQTRRRASRAYLQSQGVDINDRAFETAMEFANEIKARATGSVDFGMSPEDMADQAVQKFRRRGLEGAEAREAAATRLRELADQEDNIHLRQLTIDAANMLVREPRTPGF